MSETPFDVEIPPVDFSEIPVLETDEIIVPNSAGESPLPADPESDARPESAADRVRARLSGKGRVARDAEPSGKRAARPAKPSAPKPREGSLVKPLRDLYTSIGVMIAPFDPVCSVAIIENAEDCAKSLEALARENEAVRRAILALTQTSAWGGVLIAHMPLLLMVAMHHGPRSVSERVAPLAMMTNPSAMARAADPQNVTDQDAA
jgi:hypothetical protein